MEGSTFLGYGRNLTCKAKVCHFADELMLSAGLKNLAHQNIQRLEVSMNQRGLVAVQCQHASR